MKRVTLSGGTLTRNVCNAKSGLFELSPYVCLVLLSVLVDNYNYVAEAGLYFFLSEVTFPACHAHASSCVPHMYTTS